MVTIMVWAYPARDHFEDEKVYRTVCFNKSKLLYVHAWQYSIAAGKTSKGNTIKLNNSAQVSKPIN